MLGTRRGEGGSAEAVTDGDEGGSRARLCAQFAKGRDGIGDEDVSGFVELVRRESW